MYLDVVISYEVLLQVLFVRQISLFIYFILFHFFTQVHLAYASIFIFLWAWCDPRQTVFNVKGLLWLFDVYATYFLEKTKFT